MIQRLLKNSDTSWKQALSENELDRFDELNEEWDATSVVRAGALLLTAAGVILGIAQNSKYFGLIGLAAPYLLPSRAQKSIPAKTLQHLQLVRSRKEIELDLNQLKSHAG